MSNLNDLKTWKEEYLDKISPSFCAAKWQQVTIHLHNGHTHSCHHPPMHKIPLAELEENPSALHNTKQKKIERAEMLSGERPRGCDYCWRVEDEANGSLSDRVFKSASSWAKPHIPDIIASDWADNTVPSYVEVSFSHVCNFKCSYCTPQVSSKWMEEIQQYGAYPTSGLFNDLAWIQNSDAMPIPTREHNPYVEAFWKWWPSVADQVQHFRITGGEPLLSKDLFKFLDYLIENPQPHLEVSLNTNMCVPKDLLDKFFNKLAVISNENKVKKLKMFTSAEAYGKQAEYIRYGLDYSEWITNIERGLSEVPGLDFTIMSTYNALSVPSYKLFLEDICRLKKQYHNTNLYPTPIVLDIPYLRYPSHQTVFILTEDFEKTVYNQVEYMYNNLKDENSGFHEHEAERMKRIYEMIKTHPKDINSSANERNRKDFKIFVDEHDRRRNTNFLETFPEMENFYNHCSKL